MSTTTKAYSLVNWIGPIAGGVIAVGIGRFVPLVSALLWALIIGALVINTPLGQHRLLRHHKAVTKALLRVGVVMLGLRLPLDEILALGPKGLVVIGVTVFVTYTATCLIGDRLGVERGLVTLVAAGFSICGASAIAAVESGVRRRNEDVALAIAMVTLFGSLMIVLLPIAANLLHLTAIQTGVWAGASIHEVAQVVAAAATAGVAAVAIATTIKLGRVALLALVYLAARRRDKPDDGETERAELPIIPWFVIGFIIAAAIRTLEILPPDVLLGTDHVTTLLLASAMFGLGLGMHVKTLFPVPASVFGLAASATALAASVSLALTLILF